MSDSLLGFLLKFPKLLAACIIYFALQGMHCILKIKQNSTIKRETFQKQKFWLKSQGNFHEFGNIYNF